MEMKMLIEPVATFHGEAWFNVRLNTADGFEISLLYNPLFQHRSWQLVLEAVPQIVEYATSRSDQIRTYTGFTVYKTCMVTQGRERKPRQKSFPFAKMVL